jgi:hypothetical protein
LKDDDEALIYLQRRGIEPGVVEVLRGMLASRPISEQPPAPASQYAGQVDSMTEKRAKQERSTKQKRCFAAAVEAAHPAGVPADTTDYKLANDVRLELNKRPKPGWWCELSADTIKDHAKAYISKAGGA